MTPRRLMRLEHEGLAILEALKMDKLDVMDREMVSRRRSVLTMHVGMLVSSFQGMREVTTGKVPWGSMLASLLAPMLVSSFQGMGEVGVYVGCHVGFQLPGYGGGRHRKDTGWGPC